MTGGQTKTFSGGETAEISNDNLTFVLTFDPNDRRDLTQITVSDLNLPVGVALQYIPVKPGGSQGNPTSITGGNVNVNPATDAEAAGITSLIIQRSDGQPISPTDFTNIFVEACLEGKQATLQSCKYEKYPLVQEAHCTHYHSCMYFCISHVHFYVRTHVTLSVVFCSRNNNNPWRLFLLN